MSVEATAATWRLPKSKVTSSEKLFLLACANRAGEAHECWPSIDRLIADSTLDRKTIIKVRQSVIDKKLLEYSGEFKGRSGQIPVMRLTYVDNSLSEFTSPKNGTGSKSVTSPKNGTGTSPKNGTGDQSQIWDTESKRENLKEELKNPSISPQKISSRFDDFWEVYPLKKGKVVCEQKWISKKLDAHAEEIIAKVEAQIANDRSWIDGYIPNPLTYLNQERWTDELDIRPRGSTGKQQSTDNFHQTMAKQKQSPKRGYYDEQGNFTECYL